MVCTEKASLRKGFILKNFTSPSLMREKYKHPSAKRLSLRTSAIRKGRAVITVEASLVLPLFVFFFLTLSDAMEIVRLQSNLQVALTDTVEKTAVYGHAVSELSDVDINLLAQNCASDEWWTSLAGIAFSYLYVENAVKKYLGKSYLETALIGSGVESFNFLESKAFGSNDMIDILMAYRVKPGLIFSGINGFYIGNHVAAHIWNGYDVSAHKDEKTVFVAENGEVYHEDINCSYINIKTMKVLTDKISEKKNVYSESYRECSVCKNEKKGKYVYVTDKGSCFHYSESCPEIKRSVFSLKIKEAKELYRACGKCVTAGE